jgi:hypothetical protein
MPIFYYAQEIETADEKMISQVGHGDGELERALEDHDFLGGCRLIRIMSVTRLRGFSTEIPQRVLQDGSDNVFRAILRREPEDMQFVVRYPTDKVFSHDIKFTSQCQN